MHPLFLSHILADFLLQPTWLVRLKEKKAAGIILHSAIHGALMLLLVFPRQLDIAIYLIAIAFSHGIIDSIKIRYQKKHKEFGASFLLDQLAHFAILAAAALKMPSIPALWHTETGLGITALLFFFSFSLALFNLHAQKNNLERVLLITLVFLLFFIPASLSAFSACGAL